MLSMNTNTPIKSDQSKGTCTDQSSGTGTDRSNSVFMKKENTDYKIEYASIIKTVPVNSFTEPQPNKVDKIETRWRFMIIPGNKQIVEISRCKPGFAREYMNKLMKWVNSTVDPSFDQFVVKQYYYYSDN